MEDMVRMMAQRLGQLFPDVAVYRENQADGFTEPSFYIHRRPMTMKRAFSGIQERTYPFQIVYFPNPDKPHADMDTMIEQLAANFTELPGYAEFKDIEFDPEDTELHMGFNIFMRAFPTDDTVKQQTMQYDGRINS